MAAPWTSVAWFCLGCKQFGALDPSLYHHLCGTRALLTQTKARPFISTVSLKKFSLYPLFYGFHKEPGF